MRVRYRPEGRSDWKETDWQPVDPDAITPASSPSPACSPKTRYQLSVESRAAGGGSPGRSLAGRFLTAPSPHDPARVVFTVSTGQAFPDKDGPEGYKMYPQMLKLEPSFFVHTGDIVYYDNLAKNIGLARYHWRRTYSLPSNVEFHRQVASYFIKDDHDTW